MYDLNYLIEEERRLLRRLNELEELVNHPAYGPTAEAEMSGVWYELHNVRQAIVETQMAMGEEATRFGYSPF